MEVAWRALILVHRFAHWSGPLTAKKFFRLMDSVRISYACGVTQAWQKSKSLLDIPLVSCTCAQAQTVPLFAVVLQMKPCAFGMFLASLPKSPKLEISYQTDLFFKVWVSDEYSRQGDSTILDSLDDTAATSSLISSHAQAAWLPCLLVASSPHLNPFSL